MILGVLGRVEAQGEQGVRGACVCTSIYVCVCLTRGKCERERNRVRMRLTTVISLVYSFMPPSSLWGIQSGRVAANLTEA